MFLKVLARFNRTAQLFNWALIAVMFAALSAQAVEVTFSDYNDQGFFNNFSGDSGVFANGDSTMTVSFDNRVFHGTNGASLRVDYSVPTGFCGLWNSTLGKMSFPSHVLNFENLYGDLRNESTGNPSRVENVHVTQFFVLCLRERALEISAQSGESGIQKCAEGGAAGQQRLFGFPNQTNWSRFDFPIDTSSTNALGTG